MNFPFKNIQHKMNKITQQTVKQISKSSEAKKLYICCSRLFGAGFGLSSVFGENISEPKYDDFYNFGKSITYTGVGFITGPVLVPGTAVYFISKKIGESLAQ